MGATNLPPLAPRSSTSTTHPRGDQDRQDRRDLQKFQFTHPRVVQLLINSIFGALGNTPAWVRPRTAPADGKQAGSIHAPAWGATRASFKLIRKSFTTHPRECDKTTHAAPSFTDRVSIHAPAWGTAPMPGGPYIMILGVSIHAPAWGCDKETFSPEVEPSCFDCAPTWGATGAPIVRQDQMKIGFNSRTA